MKLLLAAIVLLTTITPVHAASSGGGSAPVPAQKPVATNLPLTSDEVKNIIQQVIAGALLMGLFMI